MPNITVQKPLLPYPMVGAEDPLHMIRELFNWNPLRQFTTALPAATFAPPFEVRETPERYVFKADMPGVKEQDIEVNLIANRLQIVGNRAAEIFEESETVYAEERTFGSFSRSFVLPEGADLEHIQAALKEGVLTVVIPKVADLKPRKIALETGGKVKA